MATLILSDGTRSIDFLSASGFKVPQDGINLPVVSREDTFAEGSDSEGRSRVRSRATNSTAGQISLYLSGATASALWTTIDNLQELVESAHLNKGSISYLGPGASSTVTYDLESISLTDLPQVGIELTQLRCNATITFESKPYGRLSPVRLPVQSNLSDTLVGLGSMGIILPLGSSAGLTDLSGNARNGTAQGGVTIGSYSPGPLTLSDGGATDFDGTNDRISTNYATRRNMATNPRFAVDTAGWSASSPAYHLNSTGVLTRTTAATPQAGANVGRVACPGTNAAEGAALNLAGQTFKSGVTYTLSMRVYLGGAVANLDLILGNAGVDHVFTTHNGLSAGTWQTISATWTPGADSATAYAIVRTKLGGAAQAGDIYFGDVLVEVASSAGVYFDGSGSYISGTWTVNTGQQSGWLGTAHASASDLGCFANGTTRTFMGWAYRDSGGATHTLVGGSNNGINGIILRINATSGVDFFPNDGSAATNWAAAWPGSTQWVHWAVVFDEPNNNASLYINGALISTQTQTAQFPSGSSLEVGSWAASQFFDGKEAWVAVREGALTATQIRDVYYSGKAQITLDGPIDSFVVSGVTGQVNAWPDFTLYESSGATVNHVEIGVLNEYVAASAPAILLQAVTQITALGGSSNTRASSYSTNILRAALATTPVAVGEATGQNNKGGWKVRARIYPSATTVRVRLAWRVGSGPYAHEPWRTVPGSAAWYDVDLGSVTIPEISVGTHSVTFRLEAMSTSGSPTVDLDVFEILPTDSYLKLRGASSLDTPTSAIVAMDNFSTQTSGAVTGKTPLLAPSGNWSGAGDADDFTVDTTAQNITRDAVSDSALNNGRYLRCGSGTLTLTTLTCDVTLPDSYPDFPSGRFGVFLRYTDTSNWLMAVICDFWTFKLIKRVAGTETVLGTYQDSWTTPFAAGGVIAAAVDATGNVLASVSRSGNSIASLSVLSDSSLATAGALASGGYGIYDAEDNGYSDPRYYDNFNVFTGSSSATISNPVILSGGAVEVTNNKAVTRNAGATAWADTPVREGKYPVLPPATRNSSKSLVVVKARRNDVDSAYTDTNLTDKLLLTASVTPRVHLTGT